MKQTVAKIRQNQQQELEKIREGASKHKLSSLDLGPQSSCYAPSPYSLLCLGKFYLINVTQRKIAKAQETTQV